jgi:hypothetical protein
MEPLSPSQPMAPLSKAAFHIAAESLYGQPLDLLLDSTLAAANGGDGGPDTGGCSEFSCNLFSPPPPDQQSGSPTTTTEETPPPPPKPDSPA